MATGYGNAVTLRTGAWFGDRTGIYPLPQGWEVTVFPPADAPALTAEGIEQAFREPIGTPPIREVARGKRSAAIIVDDLSRPTRASEVVPYVVRELREAGIDDDSIRFVIGCGAHRPLTREEMVSKLGPDVLARYQVTNHLFMSGDLVGLGTLEDGVPVYVDPVVAHADVKITVGGIIPHMAMGFGGGAKLILPGVSGFVTIHCNHRFFPERPRGIPSAAGDGLDMRTQATRVARHVGLDVIVDLVANSRRQIAGVFVGDLEAAHLQGAQFARQVGETRLPARVVQDASVVMINAYPQDSDPVQASKSMWPCDIFTHARKLVVNAASDGIPFHGLTHRIDYARYCRSQQGGLSAAEQALPGMTAETKTVFVSTGFPARDFRAQYRDGALFRSWPEAIAAFERAVPAAQRVIVLPCAPLQLPVFD